MKRMIGFKKKTEENSEFKFREKYTVRYWWRCCCGLPPFTTISTKIQTVIFSYGNTGCWVFKRGVQNWKDFCQKINISKGNYWTLRIGVVGWCQKLFLTGKFDFQSQKSSKSFSFFFIEEYQFSSTFFCFWHFLITSIFKSLYY